MTAVHALLLPMKAAHELAHAAVAARFADDWRITLDGEGAFCDVEFAEDAPAWGVAATFLAPTLAGLLGLIVFGGYVAAEGVPAPGNVRDLGAAALGALAFAEFARPSWSDVGGALAALGYTGGDDA